MARLDTDPLDGPTVDTQDIPGSAVDIGKYILGTGLFFALLAIAQKEVATRIEDATPGSDESTGIMYGSPE